MGLKLGTLFVLLKAQTDPFVKGMNSAVQATEKFSKRFAEAAGKMGQLGAVASAALGGAVLAVAKVNKDVDAEVEKIKGSFRTFAEEIGAALLPAVQALAEGVNRLLGAWQALDPATKDQIVSIAAWTAGILAAVGAISKISGLIGALSGIYALIAPILPVIAAVVAAVAGLVLLAGALHLAWRKNLGGVQQLFADTKYVFEEVVNAIGDGIKWLADRFARFFRAVGEQLKRFGKFIGVEWVQDFGDFLEGDGASKFVGQAIELGKSVGEGIVEGLSDSLSEVKSMLKDAFADIEKLFGKKGGISDPNGIDARKSSGVVGGGRSFESLSDKAPSGFQSVEVEALGKFHAAFNRAADAVSKMGASFASRLGQAGQVLSSALQGFQSGGVWGAVIAAIAELALGSQQAQQWIALLNVGFQMISDVIGIFIEPLLALSAATNNVIKVIVDMIAPVLEALVSAFDGLAPITQLLAVVLQAFMPILNIFFNYIKLIADLFGAVSTGVFKLLFEAIKYLSLGLLYIVKYIATGFGFVYNTIVNIVTALLDVLEELPFVGDELGDFKRTLIKSKISVQGIDNAIETLEAVTWDSAAATAANSVETQINSDQQKKAADTVARFNEELSNLPQGFKVARARLNSTDAGASSAISLRTATSSPVVQIFGNVYGEEELMQKIGDALETSTYRGSGTLRGGGF